MSSPLISVILSTYNREKLLSRMMESLTNQLFKDFELILINNGSVDNTESLCKKYAGMDKRIKLYKINQNNGVIYARNMGIDKSETDWICFVEDDDYCEKEYLSELYNLVTSYNADIAVTGSVIEYADKIVPKYQFDGTFVYDRIEGVSEFLKREKFNTTPSTKIFNKKLFNDVRFKHDVKIDDIHTIYKLFVNANKTVVNGKPTYRFYKHNGNTTSFIEKNILTSEILQEYLNMQQERVEYITERIPELEKQVRYAALSYMISMVEKIEEGNSINCNLQYEFMKSKLLLNKDEFLNAKWITEREINLMGKYILTNK